MPLGQCLNVIAFPAARLCSVERDENKQRTSELLQSVRANFADEIARVKVEAKCHLDAERARVDELLAGMRADDERRTEQILADVRLRLDADSRDGQLAVVGRSGLLFFRAFFLTVIDYRRR